LIGSWVIKNNRSLAALISAGWLITVMIAFSAGLSFGERSMLKPFATSLANTQADQIFNRIEDDARLTAFLDKKCFKSAMELLAATSDGDKQAMHSFLTSHDDMRETLADMKARDPTMLKAVMSYKPTLRDSWPEGPCD
jgi:hypothetical protein